MVVTNGDLLVDLLVLCLEQGFKQKSQMVVNNGDVPWYNPQKKTKCPLTCHEVIQDVPFCQKGPFEDFRPLRKIPP